jgi:hypothetical protein
MALLDLHLWQLALLAPVLGVFLWTLAFRPIYPTYAKLLAVAPALRNHAEDRNCVSAPAPRARHIHAKLAA